MRGDRPVRSAREQSDPVVSLPPEARQDCPRPQTPAIFISWSLNGLVGRLATIPDSLSAIRQGATRICENEPEIRASDARTQLATTSLGRRPEEPSLPLQRGQRIAANGAPDRRLSELSDPHYGLARVFPPDQTPQFTHRFDGDSSVRMYSMTDSDQPSMCVHLS